MDRFIPRDSSRDSLLLGRHHSRLTPREKLTRTLSDGPDPFAAHIPRTPIRHRVGSSPSLLASSARGTGPTILRRSSVSSATGRRAGSQGNVWGLAGDLTLGDSVAGVSNGRGGLLASGTNAPLYSSNFLSRRDSTAELNILERRLATALGIDTASRVLSFSNNTASPDSGYGSSPERRTTFGPLQHAWRDGQWNTPGSPTSNEETEAEKGCSNHTIQIVLDAPSLRDDYYCSLLAYSPTTQSLAVGLGSQVYLWSESKTAHTPDSLRTTHTAHVTSLSFSSITGGRGILAVGRADGRILLWSPLEEEARWDVLQPSPVCCVAFRPQPVKRLSTRDRCREVEVEELLVGDESGHLYYYSIEWPSVDDKELWDWPGAMTLLLRTTAHDQQICGLAWSPEGDYFATGGNDNFCYLYETRSVLQRSCTDTDAAANAAARALLANTWSSEASTHVPLSDHTSFNVTTSAAKHSFALQAAVKAIAFCPWQKGLVAVGGGSNDRCIHFFHTLSGACIATIDCCAQVTGLIWSTTRREIAATFGFAQPEHPYRIAVFAWPSCRQIVAIPWYDEHRALYAISYPGGPNVGAGNANGRGKAEGGMWWSRTREEGCIVVATSDCSIKFHEVWAEERKGGGNGVVASRGGLLGGSDILESLHGIDKEGREVIR